MTISAKIILDSIYEGGPRLTTFLLTYPRYIHAEFMTHRVFSRNTSSSRAIPVMRQLLTTVRDMAAPVSWGWNKPGMQAGDELPPVRKAIAKALWYGCGFMVAGFSFLLAKLGVHKQIANRPLEPWTHVTVVLTATDFANWFALRDHPDADPTIQALAQAMRYEMGAHTPQVLQAGEWHLPFIHWTEADLPLETRQKLSVARCASSSYNKVGTNERLGIDTAERIWKKLATSPLHASPFEHQATPGTPDEYSGNLRGWIQLRKTLPNEAVYG